MKKTNYYGYSLPHDLVTTLFVLYMLKERTYAHTVAASAVKR